LADVLFSARRARMAIQMLPQVRLPQGRNAFTAKTIEKKGVNWSGYRWSWVQNQSGGTVTQQRARYRQTPRVGARVTTYLTASKDRSGRVRKVDG